MGCSIGSRSGQTSSSCSRTYRRRGVHVTKVGVRSDEGGRICWSVTKRDLARVTSVYKVLFLQRKRILKGHDQRVTRICFKFRNVLRRGVVWRVRRGGRVEPTDRCDWKFGKEFVREPKDRVLERVTDLPVGRGRGPWEGGRGETCRLKKNRKYKKGK